MCTTVFHIQIVVFRVDLEKLIRRHKILNAISVMIKFIQSWLEEQLKQLRPTPPARTRRQKDVDMKSNDVFKLEFDFIPTSFRRRVPAGSTLLTMSKVNKLNVF